MQGLNVSLIQTIWALLEAQGKKGALEQIWRATR